jgi:biotin operon repressor
LNFLFLQAGKGCCWAGSTGKYPVDGVTVNVYNKQRKSLPLFAVMFTYFERSGTFSMQRTRSLAIREFIFGNIDVHPSDISAVVAATFGISRQAASRHVQSLVKSGAVKATGKGRRIQYSLKEMESKVYKFSLKTPLEEDIIWATYVRPVIIAFAGSNTYDILNYGFTEMFNNVVDHSEATTVKVSIFIYANKIILRVRDDGIGIFKKIQDHFGLEDPRHALLELVKGKVTSDPEKHTGEGIFFASRMFDCFIIWSHFLSYIRYADDDWLFEDRKTEWKGTDITMEIQHDTSRTSAEVFDKYAGEANDYGFTRTYVPVNLALYEGETLVSRSQAKRLLSRVDRFKEVWLDFKEVKNIGPAFADEIFRVFANTHPDIRLSWTNANPLVEKMIARAKGNGNASPVAS